MKQIRTTDGIKILDIFGRQVEKGAYVAAATTSYKRAHLRVGKVLGISEKGNVSIRWAAMDVKMSGARWYNGNSTLQSASVMIVHPDTLPTEALEVIG